MATLTVLACPSPDDPRRVTFIPIPLRPDRACSNPSTGPHTCTEIFPSEPRLWCGSCHAREAWFAHQLETQCLEYEEWLDRYDGCFDEPASNDAGGYPAWVYESLMALPPVNYRVN